MNLANNITVLRLILVPVFVASLLYFTDSNPFFYDVAVIVFSVACFTDALDGYIARRFNQKTVLGGYIDPLADKMLLLSGFLSLSLMEHLPKPMHIPAWVTLTVIARDVIILIGSVIIFLISGSLKPAPLAIGKITTFFQMITLFVCLVQAGQLIREIFFIATVGLTIISGLWYIRIGGRILQIK